MENNKYWFFGHPFVGGSVGITDTGANKYWFYASPEVYMFSAGGGGGTSVKKLTLLGAG